MGFTKETRPVSPKPPSTKGKVAVPKVLARFRAVVTQNPRADSLSHKPLRKLLEENPREFFVQLARMEEDHKEKVKERERQTRSRELEEEPAAGPERDEGLEAVDELITKLLAEWRGPNVGTS